MSEKNVPEVRFRGFCGEWEKKTLESISPNTYGGGTPNTATNEFWSGNIPWIQSSDLVEHDVRSIFLRKNISSLAINKSATKIIPKESIAVVTRVGVGKLAMIPFRYATSQDFLSLSNLTADKWFATYSLYRKLQNELYQVQGTSIKGITKDELLQKALHVSEDIDEQTKIGEFFKNLDNLIAQNQKKYDKLINMKKACLDKMFPKDGTDTPAVRFKGFGGEWERLKLSDVADIVGGGTPSTQIPEYWNGEIAWYSPTEIGKFVYADRSQKTITELGFEKCSAKMLPANITVLFTSRAGIGDMAILRHAATTNQGFQSFVLKDGYNTYFLYSSGCYIKSYALKNASGSTFLEISGKQLGKMDYTLPDEKEQTKIGTFFQTLDNLITLRKTELEKLKNIKKALLDKMFI